MVKKSRTHLDRYRDPDICDREVEDFFIKNNLQDVLENKRTDNVHIYIEPYRLLPRLEEYRLMTSDKSVLVPNKTFIKYIKIDSAFSSNDLNSHVKTGGFLMNCGQFIKGKFKNSDNPAYWKYAQLKYDPCSFVDAEDNVIMQQVGIKIFYINLRKCYVFYKNLEDNWRDFMEKIEIELV